ncbi:hypothetical protein [Arthrobacter globiformis]|uniref:hypothetical protein n=1 Tax=Arthrobacter globiformis TaxID=1665 RepID=UPI0027802745|nr:hypothetical protein [Arthrobacter globiformis]MDQ0867276.1 hypothetical protein [Arthrobacter globiformis]
MIEPDSSPPVPGSIGIGVVDGGYNDESQTEGIRQEVQDWLRRAGLRASPVDIPGTGSAVGPFMESVVQNVWASLLILAASKAIVATKNMRDRKHRRKLRGAQRPCLIQIWDNRGAERDAVELLRLLPDIHMQLEQAFPNRMYSFFMMSALDKPDIQRLHIKLEDYDDLRLTTWQASKMLYRMSNTPFAFMYLEAGPYGSRRISLNAI